MNKLKKIIWILTIIFVTQNCTLKSDPEPDDTLLLNQFVFDIMDLWYLWEDQMGSVDPSGFSAPADVLNALKVSQDQWSFIVDDVTTLNNLLDEGTVNRHGFYLKWNTDDSLTIAHVDPASPADIQGLNRGDIILEINDVPIGGNSSASVDIGTDVKLLVRSLEDVTSTVNTSIQQYTLSTVSYREVISIGAPATNVGYLVFNSFLQPSINELNEAFSHFEANGATELVLDLRYNGGGSVDVAKHLATLIAPASVEGEVFTKYVFNNIQTAQNQDILFETKTNNISFNRIFVITTGNTASSSEMIINSLKPFLDEVIQIGNNTAGKYVGSYIWEYQGYGLVPIVFKYANANDVTDFTSGFTPDKTEEDDLTKILGDPEEKSLAQALNYIENGVFLPRSKKFGMRTKNKLLPLHSFDYLPVIGNK